MTRPGSPPSQSARPPSRPASVEPQPPPPTPTPRGSPIRPRRSRRLWTALLLFLLLVTLGLWAASRFGKPPPIPADRLVRVERGDLARSVVAVGQIEPLSKVEVKSKANGIIQSLLVDVGDTVDEGQVLAELDKEYLDAQVRQARASMQAEEANLEVALAAESRARIEAASPESEFIRREFERVQSLVAQRIASPQALDDAQKNHEMSLNRKQLLEANTRTASAQVTQARARAAAARATLDLAEENRRHATIRSPIRGVVLTRDTEVGDAVSSILNLGSAATLILTLGDTSSVYVEGLIDEADVGKLHVGLPVRTRVEAFASESFEGTLTRIAPMGRKKDNVTTFEVRVSIANPQGRLRANMSANAEIVLEDRRRILVIPEASVIYDKAGQATVRVRDASAPAGYRPVPVKPGISNGQRREVLEEPGAGAPLAEGTELVLP